MEFLPVLEALDKPKEGIWYVNLIYSYLCCKNFTNFRFVFRYSLIPRGSAPGVSVGHTCTFIPSVNEGKGRIIIVGGANPSGSFSDSHIINLGKGIFVGRTICLISMFDLNYLTDSHHLQMFLIVFHLPLSPYD